MKTLALSAVTMIVLWGASAVGQELHKIRYEPLSAEARQLGRLDKYAGMDKRTVEVRLGEAVCKLSVPTKADAYDTVPVEYELKGQAGPNDRVAVEAVAFEEESDRKGRDLYDLAIPGNMKLKIEYLGSQTGINDLSRVVRLTPGSQPGKFPPYVLDPFVSSGTVKKGNYLFFKFRITNVGDTILDAEGFGGWMAMPEARRVAADGQPEKVFTTINQFERNLEYLYPGESFEQWINFMPPGQPPQYNHTLPVGKYRIVYRAAYRWNTEYNWGVNMWGGKPWTALEVPIEVTETGGQSEIRAKEVSMESPDEDRLTRYVGSLEEFMTSFNVIEKDRLAASVKDTLYLQVAPWTRQIVVKLIGNKPGQIKTAVVPIEVSTVNLAVRHNPKNPFVVHRGDRNEPAFCTQDMAAMRTSIQLGPEPDKHIRQRLGEARDLGVNLICSTAGDWHVPEIASPKEYTGDAISETFKFCYDVVVPELGVPLQGWGMFPPKSPSLLALGNAYWGRDLKVAMTGDAFSYHGGRGELDVADPNYPMLQAGAILYNWERWGKQWFATTDGEIPVDVEDTWGWLRDDINVRYVLSQKAVQRFRKWLQDKYGGIEKVNAAWKTSYKSFDEIDPQANQGNEGNAYGTDLSVMSPVYNKADNVFHDWTPAVDDWDLFRTDLRCDIYEQIQKLVQAKVPNAWINIRTEGGFLPVLVPADSASPHMRHVRYAQRRQALVAERLIERKVFRYHSDYTTIPYSESEWRTLLQQLSRQGMRGNYLPQFCTARDMVLNDYYGRDFQRNYNLPAPKKAVLMHVLQAAYPVWRIMYEEGHLPGVLWEDYMCDGFVTATQKHELRLFRENLSRMKP